MGASARTLHDFIAAIFARLLAVILALLPIACTQDTTTTPIAATSPQVRVLIAESTDRVDLAANSPAVTLDSRPVPSLVFPSDANVPITLAPDGWHIGRQLIRPGVLVLSPTQNPLRVSGTIYRGFIRLIPTGATRFNVINQIDIEDYLAGVVTKEMYPSWPLEAIKAQAVASRTYTLYEVGALAGRRPWDVFADQRSQMYGGISGESPKSRAAVAQTQGIVLTYGPGDGTIFKAYFSSCCGGVTQAASDAFPGEQYIPPLAEQSHGPCCNASKYFNWGPIVISKTELTRRFHIWALRRSHELGQTIAETNMAVISQIDIQQTNRYGRPSRILITDTRGTQYSWPAEQLRTAANTDANAGPTLPSSYCKISAPPTTDTITFYEGHGFGHGVGMCQWCAEAHAAAGETFAQILVDAYPQAKLVRAY